MKQEQRSPAPQKSQTGLDAASIQERNLQKWTYNIPQLPDLKLQTLRGQKVIPEEFPFKIYEINNKISLFPPSSKQDEQNSTVIAEIYKDSERNYFITAEVVAHLDSIPLGMETKLTHGSKLSFGGKLYSRDGSHIVLCLFSRDYIQEKNLDVSHLTKNQTQSVFLPKRATNYSVIVPMEARIIHSKWNFEERDHLK